MLPIKTFFMCSSIVAACLTAGCDAPPPKPNDLGRIVYSPAEVPGADAPYSMPEYLRETLEKPKQERPPEE